MLGGASSLSLMTPCYPRPGNFASAPQRQLWVMAGTNFFHYECTLYWPRQHGTLLAGVLGYPTERHTGLSGSLKGPAPWDLGGPGFSSHALAVARDAFVPCLKELQADSNKTKPRCPRVQNGPCEAPWLRRDIHSRHGAAATSTATTTWPFACASISSPVPVQQQLL
jgi:hypothetical protein